MPAKGHRFPSSVDQSISGHEPGLRILLAGVGFSWIFYEIKGKKCSLDYDQMTGAFTDRRGVEISVYDRQRQFGDADSIQAGF
jgi:hypothetical protein